MADFTLKVGESVDSTEQVPIGEPEQPKPPELPPLKLKLKARRTLNGDIFVFDHPDIDFMVSPEKMKTMVFVKGGDFSDHVYSTQNRYFEFMTKKGIIDPSTIRGSNVYRSGFEASLLKPLESDLPVDQIVLLNISNFMDEERSVHQISKRI